METLTYLYSADPASSDLFLRELSEGPAAQLCSRLDERSYLVECTSGFRPLFAQHRFHVAGVLEFDSPDLETVAAAELPLNLPSAGLPSAGPYALQLMANRRLPWSFGALIPRWIENLGWDPDRRDNRNPEHVLSAYFHLWEGSLKAYYGLSSVTDNLSPWSGGQCRIPVSAHSVSRAEQKLREALEFLPPAKPELALDLGAAPGGWTRVAQELGYQVHAVDPAQLDPAVARLSGVSHFQTTSGEFLKSSDESYDLLLCDMKMDPVMACGLVIDAKPRLKPGAALVITLKLPHGEKALDQARRGVALLAEHFAIVMARQLFFNRREVTVIAAKA